MNTAHRPWPLPKGPWLMAQEWHDLLFAHWPISLETLRPLIPPSLEIDTYDQSAWIGVVPFKIVDLRPRWVPPLPRLSTFLEINVRTYVTYEGKPGVFFFSLDAAHRLAVEVARHTVYLPYFFARMTSRSEEDRHIFYTSERIHPQAPSAEFRGNYRPTGAVFNPLKETLEYFLTERYCLYSVDAHKRLYRLDILHDPWNLQPAEAEIELNTMTLSHNIVLPAIEPLLHFSVKQNTLIWNIKRVE